MYFQISMHTKTTLDTKTTIDLYKDNINLDDTETTVRESLKGIEIPCI